MVIPLSIPVKSANGKTEITEVFVPKGTAMHISIAGLNRSRAIWGDDAKEFKPERWIRAEGPADASSNQAFARIPGVFSSIMTFSGGPGSCLGWRMAVLELSTLKMSCLLLLQALTCAHTQNWPLRTFSKVFGSNKTTHRELNGCMLPQRFLLSLEKRRWVLSCP